MNKTVIRLKGLAFYAYHGVLAEEAKLGQRFKVNVTLRLDDGLDFEADTTEQTVDYSAVYSTVESVFTGFRFKLIERAAEVIAEEILEHYAKVQEVSVEVIKPSAPVSCICDSMTVELTRSR
ncbi:dihydroneopterin aldolase [Coraliomargarita akajimensis]|uniref:7,8-dihydroneopterin aldolase n=1 Tax=Coraliomargarita akajimensis (strain DSM 45221 / IAM 15411 / JCM 23193 / KCTC 12865 / 04OKA010-24) TaxID=583355 RepID=D5END6_CORAD|nr:dihydroneopterin aldolase [Coraliomargarita akajimensis]ADE55412.1 dihydroneopterin aldolase [Coraliomargarita akajimensis DSM 45221]